MFKSLVNLAAIACVAPCLAAAGWILDDPELAKKQATEQKKGILIEFTGSDWCSYCMVLRSKVLTTEEFVKTASQDFILLELDYPQGKKQPQKIKDANYKIAKHYGVDGFPAVMFTDAEGRPFGGFVGALSKQGVLDAMREALKVRTAIKTQEDKAAQATTDAEKIDALVAMLKAVPEEYIGHYCAVREEIKKLDKEDRTGFKAQDDRAEIIAKEKVLIQAWLDKNVGGVDEPEQRLNILRSYPDRDKLQPESRQELLIHEFYAKVKSTADIDASLPLLDEMIRLAPNTELGKTAVRVKGIYQKNKSVIGARLLEAKKKREAHR